MIDVRSFMLKYRRLISAIGMIMIVAAIFWTVNSPMIVGASATQRQLPIYSVQREDKVVALSFDAAWGNEDTQALIDILNKYKVNTTFFVVGDWVDRYPESVKALADAGNEVMNHSSSHAHFSALTRDQIVADITSCNEKIEAITGVRPTLFRCPYGEYDDHVITAVRGMGMEPIQWSVERSHTTETHEETSVLRNMNSELIQGKRDAMSIPLSLYWIPIPSATRPCR